MKLKYRPGGMEAGVSKNYFATNPDPPEILSMDHIVQILNWAA
jgi:hypothetical protein